MRYTVHYEQRRHRLVTKKSFRLELLLLEVCQNANIVGETNNNKFISYFRNGFCYEIFTDAFTILSLERIAMDSPELEIILSDP